MSRVLNDDSFPESRSSLGSIFALVIGIKCVWIVAAQNEWSKHASLVGVYFGAGALAEHFKYSIKRAADESSHCSLERLTTHFFVVKWANKCHMFAVELDSGL